jgi:hypothetical protein
MTILEALAILESATLECKKREVDTLELRGALDFLEPHIQPAWLIPQFRHNLDGEQEHDYAARRSTTSLSRYVSRYPKFSQSANRKAGGCTGA